MTWMSRRSFLQTASLAAALSPAGLAAREGRRAQAQPATAAVTTGPVLKLGLIGCGWYGLVDVNAAFKVGGVEVAGICDVDTAHLADAADKIAQLQGVRPRTFAKHRDLLALPGLDAIIIASPPHWHALHLIDAVGRGLDAYCEKPLAYDIRECRAMADAVTRSGRIVQIGFQRRQSPVF